MKKIIIVLSIVLSGVFSGCTKMKVETANVQGEWKLESFYGVEAAGSVAQEVYVDFKSDGSFELFQKLGDAGHFRYFKGSYSLNGTVLSWLGSPNAWMFQAISAKTRQIFSIRVSRCLTTERRCSDLRRSRRCVTASCAYIPRNRVVRG